MSNGIISQFEQPDGSSAPQTSAVPQQVPATPSAPGAETKVNTAATSAQEPEPVPTALPETSFQPQATAETSTPATTPESQTPKPTGTETQPTSAIPKTSEVAAVPTQTTTTTEPPAQAAKIAQAEQLLDTAPPTQVESTNQKPEYASAVTTTANLAHQVEISPDLSGPLLNHATKALTRINSESRPFLAT